MLKSAQIGGSIGFRAYWMLALIMFAVVLAATDSSAAGPQDAPGDGRHLEMSDAIAAWPTFSDTQKIAVIEQLLRAGQFDAAERQLQVFQARTHTGKLEAKFFTGILRRSQGRVDEAIDIFRELLTHSPQFQRVRLELAHALFLKQEDASARHHFDLVLGSAANADLQRVVRGFIDTMDKRKRWSMTGYISLSPSTNVNQGTEIKYVYLNGQQHPLDEQSRKQSGLGLNGGLDGGYHFAISDKINWIVGGGAHFKRYEDHAFNDLIGSVETGPRYRYRGGDIAVYATASRRWFGDEEYSRSYGGRTQAAIRLGAKDIARVGLSCQRVVYDTVEYRNGWNCGVTLAEDHTLDVRSFFRTMAGVSLERTRSEHLNYHSEYAGVGYYREMPWGVSVYGQIQYTRLSYEGIYPSAPKARKDDRLDATLHLTKRDWAMFGFAPMVQYTYTRNYSNIGFHDYDAHSANLSWTKRF